jgi:hypothetical protein
MLFATVATASKIVKVIPANIIGTYKQQKKKKKIVQNEFCDKKTATLS